MKEYTSENPVFHDKISIVERADLINNQNKNESAKQLLQNTLVLKKQLDACLGENRKDGKLELADGIKADNLVGAVNEVFTLGSETKKKLAENLTAIGITSSAGETLEQLLGKVLDAVDTSGDTVTGTVLLTGYTAHNSAGEKITGGMADNGAWTGSTTGPGIVSIPEGHHNGGGYVSGQGAYDKGMADADARVNPDSTNYKNGYGAGVSSLDGTINNLNGQLNQKDQTINSLNGQIGTLNSQLNQANQLIEDLRNTEGLSVLSGNTAGSGYKYTFRVEGKGNGHPRGYGYFEFDNSKTKFRYVALIYDQCTMDVWDYGTITVNVNDHELYQREHGYIGDSWRWRTITALHDYDMGADPPSTIKIACTVEGSSAGGGDSYSGSVYGNLTLSFWGQQL